MGGRERARAIGLAVGFLLALTTTVLLVWPGSGFAALLRFGVAGLLTWTAAGAALYLGHREKTATTRGALPARFVETDRGLVARCADSYAYAAMLHLVALTSAVSQVVTPLRVGYDSDSAALTFALVLTVIFTAVIALMVSSAVIFAWRGAAVELTPDGVRTRGPGCTRFIPWAALAFGGPPRPALTANWLELVLVRPELVVRRGWGAGFGSRRYPKVPLKVRVHPWFVADAIRWYVEHPAERGTLGMLGAQNRLIAALTNAPQPMYAWPPPGR